MNHTLRIIGFTASLLTCTALSSSSAQADSVKSNRSGFNSVQKGVMGIGIDNVFLMRYNQTPLSLDPNTTLFRCQEFEPLLEP